MTESITISPLMLVFLMCMTGFAGFVDSAAGGGGLISLPAYLFAGLPAHYTYGTNKFSAACGTTFATAQFFQKPRRKSPPRTRRPRPRRRMTRSRRGTARPCRRSR